MTTQLLKHKKYLNQKTFRLGVCKALTTELSLNCINYDIRGRLTAGGCEGSKHKCSLMNWSVCFLLPSHK